MLRGMMDPEAWSEAAIARRLSRVVTILLWVVPGLLIFGCLLGTVAARGHDAQDGFVLSAAAAAFLWSDQPLGLWVNGIDQGFGAPLFLMVPPVPPLIGGALFADATDWQTLLFRQGLSASLAFLVLGACAYLWLRNHVARGGAVIGALMLLSLPYQALVLTVHRQAVAELWALAFVMAAVFCAQRLVRAQMTGFWSSVGLALSITSVILSHLATALLLLPILVLGFGIFITWRNRPAVLPFVIGCVCGVALPAIVWFPGPLMLTDAADLARFAQAFRPEQLIGARMAPEFDAAAIGVTDWVKLSLMAALAPLAAVLCIRPTRIAMHARDILWMLFALSALALISIAALPLWRLLPAVVPDWRPYPLAFLVSLAGALGAALLWQARGRVTPRTRLIVSAVLMLPLLISALPLGFRVLTQQLNPGVWQQAEAAITAWRQDPALPAGIRVAEPGELRSRLVAASRPAVVAEGRASIATVAEGPAGALSLELLVTSPDGATLALRRPAIPGWHLTGPGAEADAVSLGEQDGVLTLDVPAGVVRVGVARQRTQDQRIGLIISAVAGALLLLSGLRQPARVTIRSAPPL